MLCTPKCLAGPLLVVFCLLPSSAQVSAPRQGNLASSNNIITVEAGSAAPKLLQLSLNGATLQNQAAETLIDHVEVRGEQRSIRWTFNPGLSSFDEHSIRVVYDAISPSLRLSWEWQVRSGFGPIEHTIRIQNLGKDEVWLPLQPSFRYDWRISTHDPLERFWVEKGAGTPSTEGTHLNDLHDGDRWVGTSSTYAHPIGPQPREMIPYLLVEQKAGERFGWYIGIEFSGRTHITVQRAGESVIGEAGLNPDPGAFRTRLTAGATFETPTVFLGAVEGGPDAAGNLLRRWVRQVLNNPITVSNPSYPLLVNNTWGSGMKINESEAHSMILEAAQLGLEMFHVDAGWFRDVGDWRSNDHFPHGIAATADFAHQSGLKFGLWTDWTQAGSSKSPGALDIYNPETRDWLTVDPPTGWQHRADFKGITTDIGLPATANWARQELERIVNDYHLDMLEHDGYLVAQGSTRVDHPAAPPGTMVRIYDDQQFLWVESSNSADVSYHATQAYYNIYAQLRREHPGLMFEACNDGGRMVDFGTAAHVDYFSITDTYDPLSNRRAFFDASYVLPPAMLESYVETWPTPHIENFRYMLRSGLMGWFSLMLDSTSWTEEQHRVAKEEFSLYKAQLRPLIRTADLYHVSKRPNGVDWDGIEYFDPKLGRGVVYAFRGSIWNESSRRFLLQGLDPTRSYRIHFHDHPDAADAVLTGESLMKQGVEVSLQSPLSSELVFINAI
jgi:Melibiase/Glycosyl hydrolase family 36 C-terminal domain